MKKFFYGLLAAMFLTVSCTTEDFSQEQREGMVDFTISTSIPQGILSTRLSHNGGATNVNPAEFDLRYIMEVWTNETTPQLAYRGYRIVTSNFATTGVTFDVRLLAKEYNFVFWADFVPQGTTADHFYITANGLTNIEMSTTVGYSISNDARDAYFAAVSVDLRTTGQLGSVTLYRPFGKFRLIATDVPDGTLTVNVANARINYALSGTTTMIPKTFNALTGETGAPVLLDGAFTAATSIENAVVGGVTHNGAVVLAFDYIFAPQTGQTTVSFSATAINSAGQDVAQRDLPNIPIERNKLTTIIGNFFTNMAVMNIIVSDPFEPGDIIGTDGTEITENITGTYTLYVPNIGTEQTFIFTGTIGNSATITIMEDPASPGFAGKVNIAIINATGGTVDINLPNASVQFLGNVGTMNVITGDDTFTLMARSSIGTLNINGGNAILYGKTVNLNANAAVTITADYDKVGTVTNPGNAKFFWRVATADHLRAVLALRENNNGVILTANIHGIAPPAGAAGIAAQSALAIGDFGDGTVVGIDRTIMQGYIFDGGGFTLSGTTPRGALNQLLMIYADDVTVKNVTIANSPRSGIGLFNSRGVILDGVTTINNAAAGIVINGGEIAELRDFTSSGNGWGGINLGRGSDPGLGIPTIIALAGTIDIQDANPIWADFAGASATTFNHIGWYCFQRVISAGNDVFRWREGSGNMETIVIVPPTTTLVEAIQNAAPGSTLSLVSGATYDIGTGLTISNDVTINGNGATIVSDTPSAVYLDGVNRNPAIHVTNGTTTLKNLTLNATSPGYAPITGIANDGGNLILDGVTITAQNEGGLNGMQHGFAVIQFDGTMEVNNSTFIDFNKGAIAVLGGDAQIESSHFEGVAQDVIAQNGIQFGRTATCSVTGSVTNSTFVNFMFTPATWWSIGILVSVDGITTSGNTAINTNGDIVGWDFANDVPLN